MNRNLLRIITTPPPILPPTLRPYALMFQDAAKRNNVYYPLTNIVANGNFANGTTGWTATSGTISAVNNVMSITGNGISTLVVAATTPNYSYVTNQRLYVKTFARVTNVNCTTFKTRLAAGYLDVVINNPVQNQWYLLTGVCVVVSSISSPLVTFSHNYADAATSNGKVMEVQNVMAYDLTAIFGAGNEPTAAEMDAILLADGTPYWEGTRNVLCNPNGKYFWYDYTGNGRHEKLYGMAYTTASGLGADGKSWVLDGTNDYIRRVLITPIADGSSYSCSLIVKRAVNRYISYLHTGNTSAMLIGIDANGYLYTSVTDTNNNVYTVTDNVSKANILTHITAVVDITAMKLYLYVNGVSKGTPASLANTIRGFSTISIGVTPATDGYSAMTLCQDALINKAISAYEDKQLYNGSKRRYSI